MVKRAFKMLLGAFLGALALAFFPASAADPSYSYYEVGNIKGAPPARTSAALLLVGGGDWDRAAFRWFADHAGHGHIVIISASGGADSGDEFYHEVGGVKSVQTIEFHDRRAAYDPRVLSILSHADGIFIAGGDQSKYVRYWKGTPVARLIDEHARKGKPLGGTSAGLAILGRAGYGAMDGGSITSKAALADPGGPAVTIVGDFLHLPFLSHIVTDTHFTRRDRLGRLIAFVAQVRSTTDPKAVGLGIDEGSALAVDAGGNGRLYTNSRGYAWLVEPRGVARIAPGKPLDYAAVRISGVGPRGAINLRTLRIANAAFSKVASVRKGEVIDAPSPKPSGTSSAL
jgi:cyanophycinase